jgi:hypothetical protein
MTTYIDSRIVTLTSATAKTKYNSTFLSDVEFEMIGLLRQESDIIHTEISVLSAEIPVSFYNVTTTNNSFRYVYNGTPVTTTIAVGNYNATTLLAFINASILAVWGTQVVTLTISKVTGKFLFTIPSGLVFQYVGGTSTTNTLLGFVSATYISSGGLLTAPFPANLLGTKRISICSTYLPIYSYTSVSNTLSDTLATIEVDQPAFGLLLYKNTTQLRSRLRVDTLDVFDIQLRDELNQLLDFNNCDWSITLVLDITRKTIVDTADPFNTILANNVSMNLPRVDNLPKDLPQVDLGKGDQINSDLDLLNYNPKK